MNAQNDQEIAKKITAFLDQGTGDLRQGTVYKLQLARQAALARMAEAGASPRTATEHVMALAGDVVGAGRLMPFSIL